MESQLRPTHHRYEEDPHHHAGLQTVVEGEVEAEHHNHHGEKKSVLTKVKNKAKKIKDKIKHAGHTQEGDDYDYDEDEETVNASHVHAAPMVNESEFISGTALPKQTGLNSENPTIPLEDRQSRVLRDDVYDDVGNVGASMASDRHVRNETYSSMGNDQVVKTSPLEDPYVPNTRKADYSGAGDVGEIMVKLAMETRRSDLFDPPPATFDSERRANVAEPTLKIGPLVDLEEDPHFPKTHPHPPNYQTKVSDPTGRGGAEVDVAPLVDRLNNLHVGDESDRKTKSEEMDYTGSHDHIQKTESEEMDYTGSHDQFYPQPTPTSEQFNPKSIDAESMLPRDTLVEKISSATSLIADKAASAKDMVTSKLGYGGNGQNQHQAAEEPAHKGALESVSGYGHVVVEKLAPVYEKAAGAGSAIMSKMQRGGGEGTDVVATESDKGVSVQEYVVEKLRPGEEDRELSKVISSAIRGEGQHQQQPGLKESITVETVVSDEEAAAGVVDRVKGTIGSWLAKNPRGHQTEGEGLEKEIATKLQE